MSAELREELERQRRATLHRQLGACADALARLERERRPGTYLKMVKLRSKIARLHGKLNQRMLIAM